MNKNKKLIIGLGAAVIVAAVAWLLLNGADNGGVLPAQQPVDNTTAVNETGAGNDKDGDTATSEPVPSLTSGESNADIDSDMQALEEEDLSGSSEFGTFDSDANQL